MIRPGRLAVACSLLGLAIPALAGSVSGTGIAVGGHVEHALHLTITELNAMPRHSVDVAFETSHGPQSGHFSGALLWDLVEKSGIAEGSGTKSKHHLQHAVLITGRDGYAVTVSVGEIDPDFEGKSVILADDDAAKGARLIVPGDKHGGRDVRDVVSIDIE